MNLLSRKSKASMIKLNEIRIDNDEYVMKSCLVNPSHIVTVQTGQLEKKGPRLIGTERQRELRMIIMLGGIHIFTDETVDEIYELIKSK
jgi:hypothetical protein